MNVGHEDDLTLHQTSPFAGIPCTICTNACTAQLQVKRPLRICVQGSGTSCNSHQSHTDGAEQFFGYAQFDSYSVSFPDEDDSDTYRVQLVPLLDIINHADEPNMALSKDHLELICRQSFAPHKVRCMAQHGLLT